ncbi:LuxR C-terminal-related transcriptional regulator [Streptomyces sp. NBC_00444]|uniref:LuxR C-terminal-related transcriptional regulator n=1 Tax=Streptomyces sp. NBC_00444 TaxID=2975744 RepID=UPI002E1D0BB9
MRLSTAQREAVRDVETICSQEADSRRLRGRVAARLSRLVYWDAACFGTIDPWTLLITDDVSYGVPPHVYALAAHNEYLVDDVHKFVTLARSGAGVGILGRAPHEKRQASSRLRTVLPAFDARHEVRAACVADGQCWGAIALFRNGDQPDFSSAEAALLSAVSGPLAAGLRRTAYRPGAGVGITADRSGPGVLILGPRNETLTINDTARRWLDELTPTPPRHGGELPYVIHQVAARAQDRGVDPNQTDPPHTGPDSTDPTGPPVPRIPEAYARIRTRSGRWLTVHGSRVDGALTPDEGTAVVIEAAPTSDIAEVLMLAHALTRRERQVLQRVIAGTPSTAIATQLHISVNTVQDHLKSIFSKVGVRSRGQLVARLLGEHYLPDRD